jgi:hypothetical protein
MKAQTFSLVIAFKLAILLHKKGIQAQRDISSIFHSCYFFSSMELFEGKKMIKM